MAPLCSPFHKRISAPCLLEIGTRQSWYLHGQVLVLLDSTCKADWALCPLVSHRSWQKVTVPKADNEASEEEGGEEKKGLRKISNKTSSNRFGPEWHPQPLPPSTPPFSLSKMAHANGAAFWPLRSGQDGKLPVFGSNDQFMLLVYCVASTEYRTLFLRLFFLVSTDSG